MSISDLSESGPQITGRRPSGVKECEVGLSENFKKFLQCGQRFITIEVIPR